MPVDDSAFKAALDAMQARVRASTPRLVGEGLVILQKAGQGRTKAVSGTLRRSWRIEGPVEVEQGAAGKVGPTAIYARRIELGFRGPDSLGRVFNQLGKPYVKPAVLESIPRIRSRWARGIGKAIRG